MTLRVIDGGRDDATTSGLLIHGAAEIATMAGGLRRGRAQGETATIRGAGAERSTEPVVACWDGVIVGVGPRDEVAAALEADGRPIGRFARLDAKGATLTPGLVDPHTPLLFAGSRVAELRLRQ